MKLVRLLQPSTGLRYRFIFILGTCCTIGHADYAPAQTNHSVTPDARVDVNSATSLGDPESHDLLIDASYAFKNREEVWLEGIGLVPSAGKLSFVIQKGQLQFRTAKDGSELALLQVVPTNVHQMPSPGDLFPQPTASGWKEDLPAIHLPMNLAHAGLFIPTSLHSPPAKQNMMVTPCRPDDEGCVVGQWVTITGNAEPIQAQIAVMLIYSAGPGHTKDTPVKMLYVARQAYRGSAVWNTSLDGHVIGLVSDSLMKIRQELSTKPSQ